MDKETTSEVDKIILNALFKDWCKSTGRSVSVLIGNSTQEFFDWVQKEYKITKL